MWEAGRNPVASLVLRTFTGKVKKPMAALSNGNTDQWDVRPLQQMAFVARTTSLTLRHEAAADDRVLHVKRRHAHRARFLRRGAGDPAGGALA